MTLSDLITSQLANRMSSIEQKNVPLKTPSDLRSCCSYTMNIMNIPDENGYIFAPLHVIWRDFHEMSQVVEIPDIHDKVDICRQTARAKEWQRCRLRSDNYLIGPYTLMRRYRDLLSGSDHLSPIYGLFIGGDVRNIANLREAVVGNLQRQSHYDMTNLIHEHLDVRFFLEKDFDSKHTSDSVLRTNYRKYVKPFIELNNILVVNDTNELTDEFVTCLYSPEGITDRDYCNSLGESMIDTVRSEINVDTFMRSF